MKKGNLSKNKNENPHKKDTILCPPTPTPTPPNELRIDEEKKDEDSKMVEDEPRQVVINIDSEVKKDSKVIDLDSEQRKKKEKKKYDYDDDVVFRDIQLSSEIHIRLVSNINGYFIDIRKFFRGYPCQKGIRMSAGKFMLAYEYLKKDLDTLNLPIK